MAEENPDAAKTLLVLTSYGGLVSRFGEAGAIEVLDCIDRVAARKRDAGFEVHVYVPDNAERSTGEFPEVEGDLTAGAVRDGLGQVESLISPGRHLDYVIIVGDGEVVPFWYLENPAADSDGDFPSDVPYTVLGGSDADDYLLPDRVVARVPLAAGPGGGLLSYLEVLASGSPPGRVPGGRFGLSALQWKRESAKVYNVIAGEGLRTSPPVDTSGFDPGWLESEALFYFNVHGSKEEKYWYGQDGLSYPKVLSPDIVAEASPAGAIVLSEACYGGLVEGKTPADSVAMGFMDKGVSAFVGSSAIAYGSPDENLTEADLLAYLFYKRLTGGDTVGSALREAKIDFAAEMLGRQGYLDGDDRKTLLEFNLFGDPTVGIYKGRGLQDRRGDMVSEEVLAYIVKIARERFPEMEGVRPDVSEPAGTAGGAVAEKVGALRPASTTKGGPRPSGRILVASFRQTITVEGRRIERVVRITFHENGQVIKVVTSK